MLIISEHLEGEVLATLVVNKLRGTLKIAGSESSGFPGDRRKAMLEDVACTHGRNGQSRKRKGFKPRKSATFGYLGTASRITDRQ